MPIDNTKMTKATARYQSEPNKGERCADCTMFRRHISPGMGACTAVKGGISPRGWCKLYEEIGV